MPQKDSSQKRPEMIQVLVPANRLRRPFPLRWGLAAMGLFTFFAIVTQLQFSKISNEKIYEARIETYESDLRAYEAAVEANEDCINTIQVREVYRRIFDGTSDLFKKVADLTVELGLSPGNERLIQYQNELRASIDELITGPVEEGLPRKHPLTCPAIPAQKPTPPER